MIKMINQIKKIKIKKKSNLLVNKNLVFQIKDSVIFAK